MEIESVAVSGIIKMLVYLGAFGIVAVASGRIAGVFAKAEAASDHRLPYDWPDFGT